MQSEDYLKWLYVKPYETFSKDFYEYVSALKGEHLYYQGDLVKVLAGGNNDIAARNFAKNIKNFKSFFEGEIIQIVRVLGKPSAMTDAHLTYLVVDAEGEYGCIRSNGIKLYKENTLIRILGKLKSEINDADKR